MILTNLTRANEIGANSYLLDFEGDGRVVLDAGMHPRGEGIGDMVFRGAEASRHGGNEQEEGGGNKERENEPAGGFHFFGRGTICL